MVTSSEVMRQDLRDRSQLEEALAAESRRVREL